MTEQRRLEGKPFVVQEVFFKPYLDEIILTETFVNVTIYYVNENLGKGVLYAVKAKTEKAKKTTGKRKDIDANTKPKRASKRQKINC